MQAKRIAQKAFSILILLAVGFGGWFRPAAFQPAAAQAPDNSPEGGNAPVAVNVYLPTVRTRFPWINPVGGEITAASYSLNPTFQQRLTELKPGFVRLNGRISWRKLQPAEGAGIQWGQLAEFENELRFLKSIGARPVVIVDDYPSWANGSPKVCAPILADKFDDFASFMVALVNRYKTDEFNVHDWELGNEPDVDPSLVTNDSVFGCWGNLNDPTGNYGGAYYGEMLKAVTPQIRQADGTAKVWIGGLLLYSPEMEHNSPGRFFQGILASGAANAFDVVAYHWYGQYWGANIDYDLKGMKVWEPWGGGTVGKARFLRSIMQSYGVEKPLVLNETGLSCKGSAEENAQLCEPPVSAFYQMQAAYVVHSYARGLNEKIDGFIWYTLNGPAWRYTGLLTSSHQPTPAFNATLKLAEQLRYTYLVGPLNYGAGVEGYAFARGNGEQVQIVWAREPGQTQPVLVSKAKYKAAYDINGYPVTPTDAGANYQFTVNFFPIYIILNP